jgi:predicted nucleotidyltransferase
LRRVGGIGHNRGMRLEDLRGSNKEPILRLAASHGARNIRIFGSVARGDNSPSSDADFFVDLDPDTTLMDLGGLLTDLQDILHAPVDVATERMLPQAFASGLGGKLFPCEEATEKGLRTGAPLGWWKSRFGL